ncbi:hypothetical protein [Kitasatospora sp. NPDC002965]|uniref:hypothetical protein n=1 Tax=Kitasatospora sp. NPDC002965 TaxID=3154775 RepID=UPI0033A1828B
MRRIAGRDRTGWWLVPVRSTLVTGACLLFALPLRGVAEMTTDPCFEPGSCPETYAGLALSDRLLLTTVVLLAVQWPLAYLVRRARLWAGLAPGAALVAAVAVLFSVGPGT